MKCPFKNSSAKIQALKKHHEIPPDNGKLQALIKEIKEDQLWNGEVSDFIDTPPENLAPALLAHFIPTLYKFLKKLKEDADFLPFQHLENESNLNFASSLITTHWASKWYSFIKEDDNLSETDIHRFKRLETDCESYLPMIFSEKFLKEQQPKTGLSYAPFMMKKGLDIIMERIMTGIYLTQRQQITKERVHNMISEAEAIAGAFIPFHYMETSILRDALSSDSHISEEGLYSGLFWTKMKNSDLCKEGAEEHPYSIGNQRCPAFFIPSNNKPQSKTIIGDFAYDIILPAIMHLIPKLKDEYTDTDTIPSIGQKRRLL